MGNDAKLALVLAVTVVAAAGVTWYRKDAAPPAGSAVVPSLPGEKGAVAGSAAPAGGVTGPSWAADGRRIGY